MTGGFATGIRKGSCGLVAVAIFCGSVPSAEARPFEKSIKTCGKWVVRVEDDKKRRVKRFPLHNEPNLFLANPPTLTTEVGVRFRFADSLNQVPAIANILSPGTLAMQLSVPQPGHPSEAFCTANPTNNTCLLRRRFIFTSFRQKGKKLKFGIPPAGPLAFFPQDDGLAQQFADLVRVATGGQTVITNARVDRSRKFKFKGRYKSGKLKAKLKATIRYDVEFPGDPSRNRTGQLGRLKWRGKSKNCESEQF